MADIWQISHKHNPAIPVKKSEKRLIRGHGRSSFSSSKREIFSAQSVRERDAIVCKMVLILAQRRRNV